MRCARPGWRTAVVSSSANCQEVLEARRHRATCFEVRVDGNVVAEEHLKGKPAPDTFLAGARRLGVEPAQAAVFEDALAGVEAGPRRRLRLRRRRRPRRRTRSALREHGADVVVEDLAELLGLIDHEPSRPSPGPARDRARPRPPGPDRVDLRPRQRPPGPARQPRRGRAARPQRHVPQRLLRVLPAQYGERGYGFPEDGQAVVNVTDGKIIRLLVEDEPFDVHRGHLEHHERMLDFRTGILTREVQWRSEAGSAVRVRSRAARLVRRPQRRPRSPTRSRRSSARCASRCSRTCIANQIDRPGERRPARRPGAGRRARQRAAQSTTALRVVLAHRTQRTELALAAGMEHVIERPGRGRRADADRARPRPRHDLGPAAPGPAAALTKLLPTTGPRRQSIDWLRDQVDASLESAVAQGFDGLAERQRDYLDDFWDGADVELDGDPEIQQALRFALFHLLQASARAEGRAIAAKGLTGPGYDGHAFWDTETFVLPVLIYTTPGAAREALRWRHSTLPLARERAAQLGLRGAALPWRTIHGEECSGYWPAGTAAFHVNADVADAVRPLRRSPPATTTSSATCGARAAGRDGAPVGAPRPPRRRRALPHRRRHRARRVLARSSTTTSTRT